MQKGHNRVAVGFIQGRWTQGRPRSSANPGPGGTTPLALAGALRTRSDGLPSPRDDSDHRSDWLLPSAPLRLCGRCSGEARATRPFCMRLQVPFHHQRRGGTPSPASRIPCDFRRGGTPSPYLASRIPSHTHSALSLSLSARRGRRRPTRFALFLIPCVSAFQFSAFQLF